MTTYVARCHFCRRLLTEATLFTIYDSDGEFCACAKCADDYTG